MTTTARESPQARRGRAWGWWALAVVAACLALAGLVTLARSTLCAQSVSPEVWSPDGQFRIFTEVENCGATTASLTRVMIAGSRSSPLPFMQREETLLVYDGREDYVNVRWIDAHEVTVRYFGSCEYIHSYTAAWGSIRVLFEGVCFRST